MSNELIPFAEVKALADAVVASKLFAAFSMPQQALVLMMVAQAEGCHPMQAVQRYDVIGGRPAKKSDAMLADFQARGGKVAWLEITDKACEGEFSAPGLSQPVRIRWTIEQAQAAGLASKGTWKQYPRAMLRARVVSEGVRTSMPGVVAGLYTPEEVADFAPTPPAPPIVDAAIVPPSKPRVTVVMPEQLPPLPEDVPPVVEDVGPPAPPVGAMASPAQVRKLAVAMGAILPRGATREDRLTWINAQLAAKGKLSIASSKELSSDDCSSLITRAETASQGCSDTDDGGGK